MLEAARPELPLTKKPIPKLAENGPCLFNKSWSWFRCLFGNPPRSFTVKAPDYAELKDPSAIGVLPVAQISLILVSSCKWLHCKKSIFIQVDHRWLLCLRDKGRDFAGNQCH